MTTSATSAQPQGLAVVPKKSWVMLTLVLLVSITVPLNMFKCPGLAGQLIGFFGINGSDFGWSMSVFTIMGIVLAFPAAGIINKLGVKTAITGSVTLVIIGALLGAFSTDWTIFLVSRFLEGFGNGLVGVGAPAAITAWFPRHKRGVALGIFAPWVPIGNIIMLNLSNPLANAFGGWQAAWWFGAIWGIITLVLWVLMFKMPEEPILDDVEKEEEAAVEDVSPEAIAKRGYKKPILCASMWFVAISFCIFNVCQNGTINTFYPTYLTGVHGFDEGFASFCTSVITILAIPSGILGGILADKFKTRKWLIVAGYASILISVVWLFNWTEMWQLWVVIFLIGLFPSFACTNVMAAVSEILTPSEVVIGTAMVIFCQQIGNFIGGIAIGYMYEPMGWAMASFVLFIPLLIVAILLVALCKRLR